MEEDYASDYASELPCTLAIEDSPLDTVQHDYMEQVSLFRTHSRSSHWSSSQCAGRYAKTALGHLKIFFLQFQFKDIVLSEEEKRLLAKEGATIPIHMPLTKVTSPTG